jgi:hypothetical protein
MDASSLNIQNFPHFMRSAEFAHDKHCELPTLVLVPTFRPQSRFEDPRSFLFFAPYFIRKRPLLQAHVRRVVATADFFYGRCVTNSSGVRKRAEAQPNPRCSSVGNFVSVINLVD